ncbi:MAG: family 43 glycosylhydrolase [Muribaculaceae bacterium]|nr:family 43 glycosylhydrolase [Muribaculaceae bacterium]
MKQLISIFLMLTCSSMVGMAIDEQVYTNPVIHSDYSDPDVVSTPDGKTFYMTASSFQCAPGLPILKSENLVDWTIVNYALDAVPPYDFYGAGIPRHGKGVWAPCIRYHDGEYFIFWGDPDFGIYMVKAADPEGRWSEPVLVKEGKGLIDPTPFWDEDGKAYLANGWAASRAGFNSVITISEMTPDGTRLISKPRIVYDGNDGVNHTVEGPKMYKRGGYYYLFAPAGGVENGWQLAMRSKNVYGPYEAKIVMAQGDTDINGPHQGAWVTTRKGEDWFLHFQDKDAYGRIIHMNPMKWEDGWPVIGKDEDGDGCGEPVSMHRCPAGTKPAIVEQDPRLLFQWNSNYSDFFGFEIPDGLMRIYGHKYSSPEANLWEAGNLWLTKLPNEEFSFTGKVKISAKSSAVSEAGGASSGIVVMGLDYCRLGLTEKAGKFYLVLAECKDAETGGKENVKEIAEIAPGREYEAGLTPNVEATIFLRVKVEKGGKCLFSYSLDGETFEDIPESFTARKGKWIGAKVGFYSTVPYGVSDRGWMDIQDVVIE